MAEKAPQIETPKIGRGRVDFVISAENFFQYKLQNLKEKSQGFPEEDDDNAESDDNNNDKDDNHDDGDEDEDDGEEDTDENWDMVASIKLRNDQ